MSSTSLSDEDTGPPQDATAKFAFISDPSYPQTMSLEPDMKLTDVESAGDGWMWGSRVDTGERGLFPESYVVIHEVAKAVAAAPASVAMPPVAPTHTPKATLAPTPAKATPTPAKREPQTTNRSSITNRSSVTSRQSLETSDTIHTIKKKTKPPPPSTTSDSHSKAPNNNTTFSRPPPPMVLMKKNKQQDRVEEDIQNTLSSEVDAFVKTWRISTAKLLVEKNFKEYYLVKNQLATLLEWRRQMRLSYSDFLSGKADVSTYLDVKHQILKLIEATKQQNESFSVPTTEDGEPASISNCAIPHLVGLHKDMRKRMLDGSKLPETAHEQYQVEVEKGLRHRGTQEGHIHLFVHMKAAIFSAGEGCQLLFSLFNKTLMDFVSDEFMIALTAAGMPDDVSLMERLYTLFQNLTRMDFETGLVLVCRIYRVGKLTQDDKPTSTSGMNMTGNAASSVKDSMAIYKRHYGVSVLNLSELNVHQLLIGEELNPENTPIYQPKNNSDSAFAFLHEAIAFGRTEEYEIVPRTNGIAIGLALFEGQVSSVLKKEPRLENCLPTQRRAMSDVIDLGDSRNDLYITLMGGDFAQDSKSSAKNIEVKVSCIMNTGKPVDCLVRGSGYQSTEGSEYRSTVYYHSNSPPFNESVKLVIPPNDTFEKCHILFTFYHCSSSKKREPFGFSFLELADSTSGAAVRDGEYTLNSYKVLSEMTKASTAIAPPRYLTSKAKLSARTFRTGVIKQQDEVFRFKTTMVSTKKTQNSVLHDLINWRQLDDNKLDDVLQQCLGLTSGVSGLRHDEIFKFLREIMDALCSIFNEKRANMKGMLPVFHLFSYVLELFSRNAFKEYCPILESYIRDDFRSQKMHKVLLLCVDHYMKWIDDKDAVKSSPQDLKVFLNFMSSFNYIVWIINVSRQQDPNAGRTLDEFKSAVTDLMARVNNLMTLEEPAKIAIVRGKTLNHFPSVIDHLLVIFTPEEVAVMASGFLNAVPVSVRGGAFNKDKLKLVQHICTSPLFKDVPARTCILPSIMTTIASFMEPSDGPTNNRKEKEQQAFCIKALATMLEVIQEENDRTSVYGMVVILPALLGYVDETLAASKASANEGQYDEAASDGATALLTLFYVMDTDQYTAFIKFASISTASSLKEVMARVLNCMRNLLQADDSVYPHIWLVLHVFQAEVAVKILEWTNSYLREEMHKDAEADMKEMGEHSLWEIFYDMGMSLITKDLFDASSSTVFKKEVLSSNIYNIDLRIHVVHLLENNWQSLNDKSKLLLADKLVLGLLAQIDSDTPEISKMSKAFYFSLLRSEFTETKDFANVRDHTISAVGAIVTSQMALSHVSMESSKNPLYILFGTDLDSQFKADKVLNCEAGFKFLSEIRQLFTLLLSLAKFPKNAAHEQERCFAYSNLMDYLLKMGRAESYTRYAHFMSAEMLALGLSIESGKALLLHANFLKWNDDELPELLIENEVIFPQQSSMKRKIALFKQAIKSFDKAQYWEGSIKLCEELQKHYAERTHEFGKVEDILQEMITYYNLIRSNDRFYPSLFRVGYYGDYGPEFKNKEYVYRGDVLESIGDFTTRIRLKFPNATMLGVKADAEDKHLKSGEQFLQISKVNPGKIDEMEDEKSKDKNEKEWSISPAPRFYRDFSDNNEVNVFWYTRPFRKTTTKSANEFLDLWVEKKYLKTESCLPTTQRASFVIEKKSVIINPLENAVIEIHKKNVELREKFGQMEKLGDGEADNSYTMALNGVVDAAVNGGIGNYETFINGKYKEVNPEIYKDVNSNEAKRLIGARLVSVLKDQLKILDWGVKVHGIKCSTQLKPLHEHITMMFAKMKKNTDAMLATSIAENEEVAKRGSMVRMGSVVRR